MRRASQDGPERLVITRVQLFDYLMPMKRTFSTARGEVNASRNQVVLVTARRGDDRIRGVGEANPRNRLTGDQRRESWAFLRRAAESLPGATIDVGTNADAVQDVRALSEGFRSLAAQTASPERGSRPFRASQTGLEMALLDLAARSRDVQLTDLLGRHRDRVGITASTIPSHLDTAARTRRLVKQARRFPVTRLKGSGDPDRDLQLLEHAHRVNRRVRASKPLWIDVNEGMDPEVAVEFVTAVAASAQRGDLPPRLIVEQPVPGEDGQHLPELQRLADRLVTRRRGRKIDLRIMPDESLWDLDDLHALIDAGGCRAINIKIQKSGGLLAALDVARAAHEHDPDLHVYLGGMLATSDITAWALRSLARSFPRLDEFTSAPPGNVEARIAAPVLAYRGRSAVLIDQREPGIGTQLQREALEPYVRRRARRPRSSQGSEPVPADATSSSPPAGSDQALVAALVAMNRKAIDSHLLEMEAIAHGLHTARISPLLFTASPPDGGLPMSFYWTASNHTSRPAYFVCGVKELTRKLLHRQGLPTPEGREFAWEDRQAARRYAQQLGFPVVVKPATGTGGVGVATGLTSPQQVRWALDAMRTRLGVSAPRFIVEQHVDGDDYRLTVVGDRVVSVIRRRPAQVVGDGRRRITELIDDRNRRRRLNPGHAAYPIKLNDETRFELQRQGLRPDDVPEAGRTVRLSLAANLTQGGEVEQVIDQTHPSVLAVATAALAAIPGLEHAGIDLLLADHTRAVDEQAAAICEVNSVPAIAGQHYPMAGPPRNVARSILTHTCALNGVTLPPPVSQVTATLRVHGEVQGVGLRRWLRRLADDLEVDISVDNLPDGTVKATASGPTQRVAVLAARSIKGPRSARPDLVECHPQPESAGDRP